MKNEAYILIAVNLSLSVRMPISAELVVSYFYHSLAEECGIARLFQREIQGRWWWAICISLLEFSFEENLLYRHAFG